MLLAPNNPFAHQADAIRAAMLHAERHLNVPRDQPRPVERDVSAARRITRSATRASIAETTTGRTGGQTAKPTTSQGQLNEAIGAHQLARDRANNLRALGRAASNHHPLPSQDDDPMEGIEWHGLDRTRLP